MKIGFIGAGNMGEAYISSLSDKDISFYEIEEERREYIEKNYNAKPYTNIEELVKNVDYIILAIKPQIFSTILNVLSKLDLEDKIIVSIAAGVTIAKIEKTLKKEEIKIVRVMPNTPALIKKGVSGVSFNNEILPEEKEFIIEILKTTGNVIEIPEKQMDILTAISGSGPAYVFLLINALADGGVKLGMSKKIAMELAIDTFIGSAELIKQTGKHPEVLKDMVTSPGGTTAAGLFALEKNGVRKSLIETVEATYNKAKELGKEGE